jgi:hypothetical protein
VEPAAHAAFLDWADAHGYRNLKPVSIQDGGLCWAVADSSPNECLYGLAACPGEGITTVRVFRQGTVWTAEQAHFQTSVGRPSWRELVQGCWPETPLSGLEIKTILETTSIVIVGGRERNDQDDLVDFFDSRSFNSCRFTRGEDKLWRRYFSRDILHGGGWVTPEDLLVEFAVKHFPNLPVAGDCAFAQEAHDNATVCWTLTAVTEKHRTYTIGPSFRSGEKVEMEQQNLETAGNASTWVGLPYNRFPLD